jgi:hypothetical protein
MKAAPITCSEAHAGPGWMGYMTLAGAIEDLVAAGFAEHFGISGDALRSFANGRSYGPGEVVIREYRRFEGISDPDDMCIAYAIEAPGGARGILVDAFGVYSDARVSAFLENVPIRATRRFGRPLKGQPWEFAPPSEAREGRPAPQVVRSGTYRHGVPLPVVSDPWRDEGGEGGLE